MEQRKRKFRRQYLWMAAATVLLLAAAAYVLDFYPADRDAVTAFSVSSPVTKRVLSDNTLVFLPDGEKAAAAWIFYAGGKVAHDAYEPLLRACAERGTLCIAPKLPLRLAVLDPMAAEGYREQFSAIEHWYVGGHSLGGAMAAYYCAKTEEAVDGLILLGAYSSEDISGEDLRVLSVYGSEDGVMNREKYAECLQNLPADTEETVLDGGCHAYFGTYGAQSGDGTPTLTNAGQIALTADRIRDWISSAEN